VDLEPGRSPARNGGSPALTAANCQFLLVSFEGPDPYAAAGGLAVRVRWLSRALAARGFPTQLFFIGDPDLPGLEVQHGVHLHRWAQAISREARAGVYDAEERKIEDLCVWLPPHLGDVVAAGAAEGRTTVVLAEEWHTAWPLVAIDDLLRHRGLRAHAVLGWNANNRFGFERIDWPLLADRAALFTVSRHMKHVMWRQGVNPTVVPNGIPAEWLGAPPAAAQGAVRRACPRRHLLAKVGRWDPDKRWHQTIETMAQLRDDGQDGVLVARGWKGSDGAASHLEELYRHAAQRGLRWVRYEPAVGDQRALTELVAGAARDADVVELARPVPDPQLRTLYGAADTVLANSGFEPFGLVGLEVMASRGIVVTGSSGEDYVVSFRNGFALDSDRPGEIIGVLRWLGEDPARGVAIRRAARETAKLYAWDHVVDRLLFALQFAAQDQGVLAR
jgi:glycosyltransferase involved in cell wall biosynthesis